MGRYLGKNRLPLLFLSASKLDKINSSFHKHVNGKKMDNNKTLAAIKRRALQEKIGYSGVRDDLLNYISSLEDAYISLDGLYNQTLNKINSRKKQKPSIDKIIIAKMLEAFKFGRKQRGLLGVLSAHLKPIERVQLEEILGGKHHKVKDLGSLIKDTRNKLKRHKVEGKTLSDIVKIVVQRSRKENKIVYLYRLKVILPQPLPKS